MGLVNKLGTGVYELVSEPTKGLLKGPDEFVGGVTKGVQGLIGNAVSGGFESLSKISGGLYSVVKNVGGEKNAQIQKSEHIGQGLVHGVAGFGSEIVGGVTGIFAKPIEKTKKEGAKGFFKGLGSGIIGAISAPVTGILRAGQSITSGAAGTAQYIGNIGKASTLSKIIDSNSQYARFRPPRYISNRNVVSIFNMDLALLQQTLAQIKGGRYLSGATIRYYAALQETGPAGELLNRDPNASILIATDKALLYLRLEREGPLKGMPTLLFKTSLSKVTSCYLQQTGNPRFGILYLLNLETSKGKHHQFQSNELSKLDKLFSLLSM